MSDLFRLPDEQMRRIEPNFPLSRGVPRVDDRRIVSGIILVIRNGPCWRDAPAAHGPPKTIYNRFIRWSRMGGAYQGSDDAQLRWRAGGGAFRRIFAGLAADGGLPDRLMIDAMHLKTHRTVASLLKERLFPDVSGASEAA